MGKEEGNMDDPLHLQAQHIIEKMAATGEAPLDATMVKGFVEDVMSVLGVQVEQIVPDAKFKDDLDADSLDLVEFVMAQEERFEVTIPEDELEQLKTVAEALSLIVSKLMEKDNPEEGTSGDREPRIPKPDAPSDAAEAELPTT